jgi:hemoglobin-like flavoprotein
MDPKMAEQNRKIAAQKQVFEAKVSKQVKLEKYDAKVNQEASSVISKTFSLSEVAANTNPVIAEQNRQIAQQKEAFEKQKADEKGKSGNEVVVESWDKVKAIPNYQNIAGELLFRRIFELSPEATTLFQFANGYRANDDDMYKNEMFVKHSTAVISTVTVAVGLLKEGNMDTLVSVLKDLGARHAKFDLGEAHYSLVGESLLFTLEKALGAAFTSKVNESWVGVYQTISEQMMLGAQEYA